MEHFFAQKPLPFCPKCKKVARPNILMFGDWLWLGDRSSLQKEKYINWLRELQQKNIKVAIIEMGAGKAVPTVRMQSSKLTRALNATLIRINPRDYDLPKGNHIAIPRGAAEGIQGILNA